MKYTQTTIHNHQTSSNGFASQSLKLSRSLDQEKNANKILSIHKLQMFLYLLQNKKKSSVVTLHDRCEL